MVSLDFLPPVWRLFKLLCFLNPTLQAFVLSESHLSSGLPILRHGVKSPPQFPATAAHPPPPPPESSGFSTCGPKAYYKYTFSDCTAVLLNQTLVGSPRSLCLNKPSTVGGAHSCLRKTTPMLSP